MAVTNGIPPMGFGTFGRTGSAGIDAIGFALETGYRHLDTAQSYGTERECGEALRRSGIARDAVFLTTKIAADNCRRGRLIESLKRSAEALSVDAVDLALIHWPVSPAGRLPMAEYLPELAEAQDLGLTRLIGVSNFTIADIREAESMLGTDWLATNQVERHPLLRNQALVDACAAHAIAVTCYLPLARGRCAGIPVIEAIARAHNATAHQVALAFSLCEGHIVIPTSGHPDRIAQNYAARDLVLSPDDLAQIRALDRHYRQINPTWSPAWD